MVSHILAYKKGKATISMFWIALASYLSLYPIMLVPALLLLSPQSTQWRTVGIFTGWMCGLLVVSRLFIGSWSFIQSSYGTM
jgi:phosphatidylinositol glycan class U